MLMSIPQIARELGQGEQKIRRYAARFSGYLDPQVDAGVQKYEDVDQEKFKRICELYDQGKKKAEIGKILESDCQGNAESERDLESESVAENGKIEFGPETLSVLQGIQSAMENLTDTINRNVSAS